MHSVMRNNRTQGSFILDVKPEAGSTQLVSAIMRGALTMAVLSLLLLTAARPVQAQTESVLYNFTSNPDGANPGSSLTLYNGNFYGTTYAGGLGSGTVFELTPNGTETILYNFCTLANCVDGENPTYSNVIFDGNGNMYGTTYAGGANGLGTVFELSLVGTTWTETVLYSFAGDPDGANPVNGLIMDASGNLYGVTYNGGIVGDGTVYELTLSAGIWSEQVLQDIKSTYAGLTINGAGDIFGNQYGSIFQLTPNGKGGYKMTTIYRFTAADAAKEGQNPDGTLVFDTAGNLYGTTFKGGTDGFGAVYKLTPPTTGTLWKETLLSKFGTATENPVGGVVLDSSGNIYGTTTGGGKSDDGAVFELVAPTSGTTYTQKVLFTFTGENGNEPFDSLTLSGGYLYGTTYLGGVDGEGTVFVVNPAAAVTTTTLTASPNPATEGTTVTFTATVSPAPPNGEVVVFEPLGQTTMTGGVATFTSSTLAVGTTKIRAVYGGDLNFITSMSAWLPEVVTK